jgi:hypothetical protein
VKGEILDPTVLALSDLGVQRRRSRWLGDPGRLPEGSARSRALQGAGGRAFQMQRGAGSKARREEWRLAQGVTLVAL